MAANVGSFFALLYTNNVNMFMSGKFRAGLNNRVTICYKVNRPFENDDPSFYQ